MKLFNIIALVSSFVAADNKNKNKNNKKNPPRTPEQRLQILENTYREYVNDFIEPIRPYIAHNQIKRINNMVLRIRYNHSSWSKRECTFFDQNVPHGGPRPENSVDGERKRRDVDTEDPFDIYEEKYENGDYSATVRLSEDFVLALRQVWIPRIDAVLKVFVG